MRAVFIAVLLTLSLSACRTQQVAGQACVQSKDEEAAEKTFMRSKGGPHHGRNLKGKGKKNGPKKPKSPPDEPEYGLPELYYDDDYEVSVPRDELRTYFILTYFLHNVRYLQVYPR